MTNEILSAKYNLADSEIQKLSESYMALRISNENDKEGFALVKSARLDIRGKRTSIEAKRKEMKAEALEYGRVVDGEAKRLTALLEPIETYLEKQEAIVTEEIERKKAEKKAAEAARTQGRISALQSLGASIDLLSIQAMTDDQYQTALVTAKAAWDIAEAKRIAEKQASAKLESEREADRARLAASQAEAEKAKRESDAAKAAADKAIRDAQEAQRAAEAKAQAEKDKAAAIERARIEESKRIKTEAESKAKLESAAERADEERKAREEALKPEREKIADLANRLATVATEKSLGKGKLAIEARTIIALAIDQIRKL